MLSRLCAPDRPRPLCSIAARSAGLYWCKSGSTPFIGLPRPAGSRPARERFRTARKPRGAGRSRTASVAGTASSVSPRRDSGTTHAVAHAPNPTGIEGPRTAGCRFCQEGPGRAWQETHAPTASPPAAASRCTRGFPGPAGTGAPRPPERIRVGTVYAAAPPASGRWRSSDRSDPGTSCFRTVPPYVFNITFTPGPWIYRGDASAASTRNRRC
jgi:hypothetical protein